MKKNRILYFATFFVLFTLVFCLFGCAENQSTDEKVSLYFAGLNYDKASETITVQLSFGGESENLVDEEVTVESSSQDGVFFASSTKTIAFDTAGVINGARQFVSADDFNYEDVVYKHLKFDLVYATLYKSISTNADTSHKIANKYYHILHLDESSQNTKFVIENEYQNSPSWYAVLVAVAVGIAVAGGFIVYKEKKGKTKNG